ncbi:MAG TPA: DUF6491 family protein [Steroidobacteraceae bacterium]|nr:DUF6491 family protein [Steroidobacteraceae bacterium]
MKTSTLSLLCLAGLLAACSSAPERTYVRDPLDRYDRYAGPPIDRFAYRGSLDGWRAVDRDRVVVWTTPDDAYLLTVERDCQDLTQVSRLRLTSSREDFDRTYDYMVIGGDRCRITDIRHVDYAEMRHDAGDYRRDDDYRRDRYHH